MRDSIPTSVFERVLLLLTIVALPADDHFRIVPGYSILFLLFVVLGIYVLAVRFAQLLITLSQPTILACLLFLALAGLIEFTHPLSSYSELIRIAQMILGGILIGSICRDLQAIRMACYGYLVAGVWLSVLLFLTSYGALNAATASDFHEASQLRDAAFDENPLQANLNTMAFGAGQAAIVALAWALSRQESRFRLLFIGVGLFCLVGAFLPLSRGGVAITIISCVSVMYAFGLRHGKALLIAVVIAATIASVVPQAVWSRMSFSFEEKEGKIEGRALIYQAAIDHLPDYLLTGVGAGNFWSGWGRRSEFATYGRTGGAHNCFFQVTLYWGMLGAAALALVFWNAYRCVPRACSREASALCLLGIGVGLLLFSMVVHNLYSKEFSLGLGLLVGARTWVWPYGVVYATPQPPTVEVFDVIGETA
ncbi:O-antigen ligase family protein [Nitrospira sp. Nam80]